VDESQRVLVALHKRWHFRIVRVVFGVFDHQMQVQLDRWFSLLLLTFLCMFHLFAVTMILFLC